MKWVCSKEEVESFIKTVRKILLSGKVNEVLNIIKQNKCGDKTNDFMIYYNVNSEKIRDELLKLDITNYSYTAYDDNPSFSSEMVWIFGQMFENIEVYIKLKIRSKVICLSFHEAEHKLKYPYL